MSNFKCEKCGAICSDTEKGYVTGCEHYPPDIPQREGMNREALSSRVKNSSFYEEPYNMLNDVQIKRIIDLIEADYEARVVEAIEKLLPQYYGSTDMRYPLEDAIEAIKALRGER